MGNKFDALFVCLMVVSTVFYACQLVWFHTWAAWGTVVATWSPVLLLFACLTVMMVVTIVAGVLCVVEKMIDYRGGYFPADPELADRLAEWLCGSRTAPVTRSDICDALIGIRCERLGREPE